MKKNLCGLICFCSLVFFVLPAFGEEFPLPSTNPIVNRLALFIIGEDQELSLGAMLISVDINNTEKLEWSVREGLREDDPSWVKAIKTYTLSCYTNFESDTAAFIRSIPEDKENFQKLIEFECTVTRCPTSKILNRLMSYAQRDTGQPLQKLAMEKLKAIRLVADGWVADSIDD